MTDYNVISQYEWGIWHGLTLGLTLGCALTLWIVFGGLA